MQTYSILRSAEEAKLAKLHLQGRVIDLGGHKKSHYYSLLNSDSPIEVANYDTPDTHKTPSGADHVFDLEAPFPFGADVYDNVLCINVLEHLYNYQNLLSETYRILRPGGYLYLSVPFFFNIHGSPNDYFRFTKASLIRLLEERGFKSITITELGHGPLSVVFQTFGGSLPTMPLKMVIKNICVQLDRFFSQISKRYASINVRVPLGYFLEAKK